MAGGFETYVISTSDAGIGCGGIGLTRIVRSPPLFLATMVLSPDESVLDATKPQPFADFAKKSVYSAILSDAALKLLNERVDCNCPFWVVALKLLMTRACCSMGIFGGNPTGIWSEETLETTVVSVAVFCTLPILQTARHMASTINTMTTTAQTQKCFLCSIA